jgi:zinc protease
MKKNIFFLFAFLIISGVCAQSFELEDEIPFDNSVLVGKLDNGITYYIKENMQPQNRAHLRLVVNAGSVLEDEDQLGLAHFVEHMCFNGTKNFEKNELVSYLESIGMQFGPGINAYTSFDKTIYLLELPADSLQVLEKGMEILEEWAHNVSLEDEEIEKERGVITEEWRTGRGAGARIREKQYPAIFNNSLYAYRLPIGDPKIIESFEHETLRRFYNDWYRPDLMAVIAVGDFDKANMEELIKKYFNRIKPSENVRERFSVEVPDHKDLLFSVKTDKELSGGTVSIFKKLDLNSHVTVKDYRTSMIERLYNLMMNARLKELMQSPEPPFTKAGSSKGNMVRTKQYYFVTAHVSNDGIKEGLRTLLTESERVKQYGFTETELERQKDYLLVMHEQSFNERDKSESKKKADELMRNYLQDEPVPGIEYEYGLNKVLLPTIKLEEVNALSKIWLEDENKVVTVSASRKEGFKIPDEAELKKLYYETKNKILTPYKDEVNESPILSDILEPSNFIYENNIDKYGITELELANGVKVVLKPTDFKNDEILFSAFSPGGTSIYTDEEYTPAALAAMLVGNSGVGDFNNTQLKKKLTGKNVSVRPQIGELNERIKGSCAGKDTETMFQLIYQYFNAPRIDSATFLSSKSRIKTNIENKKAVPEFAWQDTVSQTLVQYHPRRKSWDEERLNKMDMNKSLEIYKDRFADASDFTFVFVGSFEIESIKPYLQRYLGNLPSIKRVETWKDIGIVAPKGVINKTVKKGIEPKSIVNITFTGDYNWSSQENFNLYALISATKIRLREIIREDNSGTYGVKVGGGSNKLPNETFKIEIVFGCNPERVEELCGLIFKELNNLRGNEIDEIYITKVKEIYRRKHEVDLKKNKYWLGLLQKYLMYGIDYSEIDKADEKTNNISASSIRETANKYLDLNNYLKVVLYPEK